MSGKRFTVAVIGATGAVGEAVLSVLFEREFPVAKLHAVSRDREEDETVLFAERPVELEELDDFDFSSCQLAFFCAPAAVAKKHAPRAVKAGCWVIDVSQQFRLKSGVPLAVPTVDSSVLEALATEPRLIASPGAPAVQLATVLQPLAQQFGLRRVNVITVLSVSAKGRAGVNELAGQTARLLNAQSFNSNSFPVQIAFNIIPAFDAPYESGYTHDEQGDAAELIKVLKQPRLKVSHSALFAPVFYGHSQIVTVETERPVSIAGARAVLAKAADVDLAKAGAEKTTSIGMGTDSGSVVVGRVCQVEGEDHSLTLWTIADNIRKGAAVNAVQIAETLLKSHL